MYFKKLNTYLYKISCKYYFSKLIHNFFLVHSNTINYNNKLLFSFHNMLNDINSIILHLLLNQSASNPYLKSDFIFTQKLQQNQISLMVQSHLMNLVLQQKLKSEIIRLTLLNNLNYQEIAPTAQIFEEKSQLKQFIIKQQEEVISEREKKVQRRDQTVEKELKRMKGKKQKKIVKNETKNIPKNYGKAIINFVQKNEDLMKKIIGQNSEGEYKSLIIYLNRRKKKINSIAQLRGLWLQEQNIYAKQLRIISLIFLRKYGMSYIFNSRISNFQGHIKYRNRLIEALKNPSRFTNIKLF